MPFVRWCGKTRYCQTGHRRQYKTSHALLHVGKLKLDTCSEYVTAYFAFPPQEWLCERASILRLYVQWLCYSSSVLVVFNSFPASFPSNQESKDENGKGHAQRIFLWRERYKARTTQIKIMALWDVTPCSLVERYQRFERTCCLHLQEPRYMQNVPWNRWYRSTKLHGVTP